ncbi:hypothetical protein SanaruYs_00400 [Chryseotalea sanaruensis]|uniref:Protein SirB1 N-terminal domain-containing protein n=1 Tax=Chryseotalea sanaruensis TaxID=2482724 RepID=A0A401U4W5_9BACT|nr:hypothetical protein [Chryseotalea sanaruensis]GCC49826.1 hypothetical protein SanaruYs_00400 [Chryseotalea sanaruensis]
MRSILVLIAFLWAINIAYGQSPSASIPNPSLPTFSAPAIQNPQYNRLLSTQEIQKRNMHMIEQDMRNHELDEKQKQDALNQAYKELGIDEETDSKLASKISHSYAVNKAFGFRHFEKAFEEISGMIEGKIPYNLKRAVFLTEHAYDTTLNYERFERQIAKLVSIIQLEMMQQNISPNDNLGKIMAAFRFMADTLRVKNPVLEKTITTYPKTYDFEDFYGMQDYHKMFVSKLIKTGKGQCHSLPLLFLILCQEINAKAYLSFSPEHCYIKFKDDKGNLNNIELTNQMFTTDQFVLQSGYITSAAIKSRIYMDTLGLDRIINFTLNDLTNSYVKKYGYDDFVLKCSKRVLAYDSKSIHAYMHIANYYNVLGHKVETQYNRLNIPRVYYFSEDQKFREIIKNAIDYGKTIDNLGFAQMPPEMYQKWLGSLKSESMKQQHLERRKILSSMTEF